MRSEAELWEARARAADNAAEQLARLRSELSKVLDRYHFGTDCIEGQELHAALRAFFDVQGEVLEDSAVDTRRLAADCRSAALRLAHADEANCDGFAHAVPG